MRPLLATSRTTSAQLHEQLLALARQRATQPSKVNGAWQVTSEAEALWVIANTGFITRKQALKLWPKETQLEVACRLLNCMPPSCSVCAAPLSFKSLKSGWTAYWGDTCTAACARLHPSYHERRSLAAKKGAQARLTPPFENAWSDKARTTRRNTNLERYGHHTARSPAVEERRKSTLLQRHGTSNSFQTAKGASSTVAQKTLEKQRSLANLLERNPHIDSVTWNGHMHPSVWACRRCNGRFDDVDTSPIRALRCPRCDPPRGSMLQHRLRERLEVLGLKVTYNTRKVIAPLELDIFLPEHRLAIEVNGLFWHSFDRPETREEREAALVKWRRCNELDIQLLTFTEDELLARPEQCIELILHRCGRSRSVGARKLELRATDLATAQTFMRRNHLHGAAPASKALGLWRGDELVQALTLSRSRFQTGAFEVVRFATLAGWQVQGGASKLLKEAKAIVDGPLLTYANRSISRGTSYAKLGTFIKEVPPGYRWWKGDRVLNRAHTRRAALPKLLGEAFDPSKTEAANMFGAGWRRIWDCGHLLYQLNKEQP